MRLLVLIAFAACGSERAPLTVVSPTRDATVVDVVAAPASASAVVKDPADAGETLLARLAREAAAIPKGELHKSPPPDAERDELIHKQFSGRCRLERTCGALWGIDCQAAVDGPYYYVRPLATGLQRITVCGGACMGGRCTNCPPKNEGWTCETY